MSARAGSFLARTKAPLVPSATSALARVCLGKVAQARRPSGAAMAQPHRRVRRSFEALLTVLESHAERIRECAAHLSTQLSCASYDRDYPPGIRLSASVLQRIIALGIPLDFGSLLQRHATYATNAP